MNCQKNRRFWKIPFHDSRLFIQANPGAAYETVSLDYFGRLWRADPFWCVSTSYSCLCIARGNFTPVISFPTTRSQRRLRHQWSNLCGWKPRRGVLNIYPNRPSDGINCDHFVNITSFPCRFYCKSNMPAASITNIFAEHHRFRASGFWIIQNYSVLAST